MERTARLPVRYVFSGVTDTNRYRQEAEECRQRAAKALSTLDKEAWLKLAEDWLKLAEMAETRERPSRNHK